MPRAARSGGTTPSRRRRSLHRQQDKPLTSQAGFDHHLIKPVALEALEKLFASTRKG